MIQRAAKKFVLNRFDRLQSSSYRFAEIPGGEEQKILPVGGFYLRQNSLKCWKRRKGSGTIGAYKENTTLSVTWAELVSTNEKSNSKNKGDERDGT